MDVNNVQWENRRKKNLFNECVRCGCEMLHFNCHCFGLFFWLGLWSNRGYYTRFCCVPCHSSLLTIMCVCVTKMVHFGHAETDDRYSANKTISMMKIVYGGCEKSALIAESLQFSVIFTPRPVPSARLLTSCSAAPKVEQTKIYGINAYTANRFES